MFVIRQGRRFTPLISSWQLERGKGWIWSKEALGMYQDERHLTGVGFEAKEAAAPYGKDKSRGTRKQICDGNL